MKVIYTNITPVTKAYTNFQHIFYLKNHKPQKVYLCVWDSLVFEHPAVERGLESSKERAEKLKENVDMLERLLSHLKIDYKIIYLSEATKRLFKNSQYLQEFQNILSNIKVEELEKGESLEYTPFKKMSISKINHTIADYLIATYLAELFPEICSNAPNFYLTSERFRVFSGVINHYLRLNFFKHYPPKPIYVTGIPVIIHPEKEIIPSAEMSLESIRSIVSAHYTKHPSEKETEDILNVLSTGLNNFSFKEKKYTKEKMILEISNASLKEYVDFVSLNLYDYFNEINKIVSKIKIKSQKKSHLIKSYEEFMEKIKPLNNIKLTILKYCNGKNSSLDISRSSGLKLSTVSTYLTHLKNDGILENNKKPRKMIDSFVIDLEVLG